VGRCFTVRYQKTSVKVSTFSKVLRVLSTRSRGRERLVELTYSADTAAQSADIGGLAAVVLMDLYSLTLYFTKYELSLLYACS